MVFGFVVKNMPLCPRRGDKPTFSGIGCSAMLEIYRKAALCRAFEDEVYRRVEAKEITIPVYLSSGQEYIAATVAHYLAHHKPAVFVQHRNHAQYLCFGGSMRHLIRELIGKDSGMQGSASIADGDIFGHDGFMGSQVPISVGYCDATKRPTICFLGDAAAEEDYVLSSLGWAATRNLPILFVVEDNNLAILTEKSVRRSWHITQVAGGFGLEVHDIADTPDMLEYVASWAFKGAPMLANVRTARLYWHAGAGKDGDYFDRHAEVAKTIPEAHMIDYEAAVIVEGAWRLAHE